jgi:DNA-directed RNA polymerase subunit alpha
MSDGASRAPATDAPHMWPRHGLQSNGWWNAGGECQGAENAPRSGGQEVQSNMKWKNLVVPRKIEVDEKTLTDKYGRFVIAPLERGFGLTLGNALRRVLLSSLPGAAVTAVRINGALHEFSTIPGVLEDTTELTLNLKQMRVKLHSDGTKRGTFEGKGKMEIVAGDLKTDPDVEVLNPDLHIATVNKDGDLSIEVEIGTGRGYVSADAQGGDRPIGETPVDALFSPVSKVNYSVESERVGQRIDYDRLTLQIWTDGSLVPGDALSHAAKILRDHFSLFIDREDEPEEEPEEIVDESAIRIRQLLDRTVDELELSVRSSNCLKAANIRTLGDLVQKNEAEMLKYRNFGRKSLKEISDILSGMGLHFGMDVRKYYRGQSQPQRPVVEEEVTS